MIPALLVPSVRPVARITGVPAALFVGQSKQLALRQYLISGGFTDSNTGVGWSSSNQSVATVSVAGLVTMQGNGTATITATLGGKSYTGAVQLPVTVADTVAAFNLAGGGTTGATFRTLYIPGVQQTIVANGGSPTGYYCTFWDDAIAPGAGKHWRPASGFANGSPCLVTGEICGEGLEIPAGKGLLGGIADPTLYDGTNPDLAGSDGIKDFYFHRGAGYTIGGFAKMWSNVGMLSMGEDADPDFLVYTGTGETQTNFQPLDDDLASGGFQHSSSLLHFATWQANQAYLGPDGGGYTPRILVSEYARDLRSLFWGPSAGTWDWTKDTQRVRIGHGGGRALDANNPISALYFAVGRKNKIQNRGLNDWAKAQSWGVNIKDDTRRIGVTFGDSFVNPASMYDLVNGLNGAPAIPQFACMGGSNAGGWPQSGHTPAKWQYPFINFFRDCDFSKRPVAAGSISVVAAEWENGGSTGNNTYWWTQLKALDSRVRVSVFNDERNANNLTNTNNDYLDAHALQDGYATRLIDFWRSLSNDPYHMQDGTAPNRIQILWNNSSHPSTQGQEYKLALYRSGHLANLGIDDSSRTVKIDPGNPITDHVILAPGAPTYQIVPIPRNALGAALAGKTFVYTALPDTTKITVSASGLVTRVATTSGNPPPYVKIVSNDGGVGVLAVDCTGSGAILTDTFTRTAGVPGTADTGQAWSVTAGAWSTNGTQLVADATSNARLSIDPGSAVTTVSLDVLHASNQQYVAFRWSDGNNYWIAGFQASSNNLQLWKVVAGSFTELGTIGGVNVGAHTGTIKVDLASGVNVYYNNVLKQTSADAFNSSSRTVGAFGVSGVFDNMSVT